MSRADKIREGIAAARARGVEWGRAGRERAMRNRAQADERAEELRGLFAALFAAGVVGSTTDLAYRLNVMGVPTARGGHWSRCTVRRVLRKLGRSLTDDMAKAKASGNHLLLKWPSRPTYAEWLTLAKRDA